MNIEQLHHSLKVKWLVYYRQHRPWIVRLGVWSDYNGQRRPSSSFILATVATLEPQLTQLFPFIADLNNDPDQIIPALGLDFDPDIELKLLTGNLASNGANSSNDGVAEIPTVAKTNINSNGLAVQMPTHSKDRVSLSHATVTSSSDDLCSGKGTSPAKLLLSILAVVGSLAVVWAGWSS